MSMYLVVGPLAPLLLFEYDGPASYEERLGELSLALFLANSPPACAQPPELPVARVFPVASAHCYNRSS